MNPFEQILREMAKKAEQKNRFAHLTDEQRVDKMMECNRAFWEHITFNITTAPDGDVRCADIQVLITAMKNIDLAQYHRDHCLIDEDEAPRKESKLRCNFWDKHHEMVKAAVAYAEYCGYITVDHAAIDKEEVEIESRYEAMKPEDCDAARTDAQTDNEAE